MREEIWQSLHDTNNQLLVADRPSRVPLEWNTVVTGHMIHKNFNNRKTVSHTVAYKNLTGSSVKLHGMVSFLFFCFFVKEGEGPS